jgi:hypothetical protein
MSGLLGDRDGSRNDTGLLEGALAGIRTDARARWAALAAGAIVGLEVAWVHWYGFLLGGALVGLASKNAERGLAAGLGFGLLA